MSAIYGDRMQILLPKKEKYGIKPKGRGYNSISEAERHRKSGE